MTDSVTLVSRRSALAMWQTRHVATLLREAHPSLQVEIVGIDTTGDKVRDQPLPKIGTKGLFTRELEESLVTGDADIAVHSLKDLPTELPEGLVYAGSPPRAAPTDSLVAPAFASLDELPDGATIATGSVRRRAQLTAARSTFRFAELRGNIDTRLRKLEENGWAAIVMATAALHRLDRSELISFELDPSRFVPAPSQGAIGLEIREDREDLHTLLQPVLDESTNLACRAERIFMRRLEGGCSVPVAAHCRRDGDEWEVTGWVGTLDGSRTIHEASRGPDASAAASALAEEFLSRGAAEILRR